ncbi:PspC domain-containing protein [Sunxiuqinia indica]|jgi:phage shock protein C|uniref:PspC domain-containing protein n=1 Tax=Sunxiuqinia indica TaxID=2692584 RepID=UPI0013577427|nr:PspC domain-containing protein [Sunxiuqinia indica]
MKRLTKSYDKRIAGVCGGFSEYINPELDPVIVRIIFAVLAFMNPLLIVAYLVLAIALPDPDVAR